MAAALLAAPRSRENARAEVGEAVLIGDSTSGVCVALTDAPYACGDRGLIVMALVDTVL